MNAKLNRLMKDESGITALETAIILIAFVVVAAIFAFTVLSTGTFLTERSKEAAYSGLQEVRGSMELKGGVVVSSSTPSQVDFIAFTLATVAGGQAVDLGTKPGAQLSNRLRITYRDTTINKDLAPTNGSVYTQSATSGAIGYSEGKGKWYVSDCTNCSVGANGSSCFLTANGDCILKPGALARIYAFVPDDNSHTLKVNETFAIEVKPPTGGTMLIERTLPAGLDSFTDLH